MATTIVAKVLAMRAELISVVRDQINSAIDDSGATPVEGADIENDGRGFLAEYIADALLEAGWVSEHPDGNVSPFEADPEPEATDV